MVKLIMLNKKIIFLSVLMYGTLAYAVPNQSDGKKAKNYESFKINKIERIQEVIETKLFGEPKFNSVSVVTSAKGGNYFDYYFVLPYLL